MSINNVYRRLESAIVDCEKAAVELETRKNWAKGMADGYRFSLITLQEEGVVPTEEPINDMIIPFSLKD